MQRKGLTPKQRKVLDVAVIPGLKKTITAICEEAKTSRKSFYRWYRTSKTFRKAWDELWDFQINQYLPSVVAAQIDRALKGYTPAARLLFEISGRMKPKVDGPENVEIVVRYEDADKKPKR